MEKPNLKISFISVFFFGPCASLNIRTNYNAITSFLTCWTLVLPCKSSPTRTVVTFDTRGRELNPMSAVSCIENGSITVITLKADLTCSLLELILVSSIATRYLV